MKISGTEYKDKRNLISNNRSSRDKVQSFSKEMDNSFFDKSKKDLKELLNSIKSKGDRVVITKNYSDVIEYKKLVKQYLQKVIGDMYELNKSSDAFLSRYYLTVETVDKKLYDLTDMILNNEKDNINILNTLDEIQGLILDVYK